MEHQNWNGFNGNRWKETIDVRDFIQANYTEYLGGAEFLAKATARTSKISRRHDAARCARRS